jgi:hypothetical protein
MNFSRRHKQTGSVEFLLIKQQANTELIPEEWKGKHDAVSNSIESTPALQMVRGQSFMAFILPI